MHNPKPTISHTVLFGFIVLFSFFGTFGFWSVFTPLDSAAIAPGKVTVDSNRKTIQHLEGGIVKAIFVREAKVVKKGDLLIQLDDTQAKTSLKLLTGQSNALTALESRLIAERDHEEKLVFPKELSDQKNIPEVEKILSGQLAIFKANKKSFEGQMEILGQRITQLEKEIEGFEAQVTSETTQLELIGEEVEAVEYLEKKKLIEKPRLLALKRESAKLSGNRGKNLGEIAKSQQKIGETKTQMISLEDKLQSKILEELRNTQEHLADILERKTAAADILARTHINAPEDGTVVNLIAHTIGGVISPGQPILDIVPTGDELVVEVHVNPLDIDVVHAGLIARIQFTAFKQRSTPSLKGTVIHVSADSMQDPQTGEVFYQSRIRISKEEMARLNGLKLYPGMPAQAMIITDNRTPWQYFSAPIRDSFGRAFREQ